MRRFGGIIVVVLAILGAVWLVRICQQEAGSSPADQVVDTFEEAADEVGDTAEEAVDETGDLLEGSP